MRWRSCLALAFGLFLSSAIPAQVPPAGTPQKQPSAQAMARLAKAKASLKAVIAADFVKWDANGDGVIQNEEMSPVVQDPLVAGDDAAAAAALKMALRSTKKPCPPLTKAFFEADSPDLDGIARSFASARARLSAAKPILFAHDQLELSQCRQGALGDCYLLAATGAAIHRQPDLMGKMILPTEKPGEYKVAFQDGVSVSVAALTPSEIAMGGASIKDGLWLRVLEKAWGQRLIDTNSKNAPGSEPTDIMGHGGTIAATLRAMTGHVVKVLRLSAGTNAPKAAPIEDVRQALKETLAAHLLAGAGTPEKVDVPGVNPKHAYAVLSYDEATDMIELWNPHVNKFTPKGEPGLGSGYSTTLGVFKMPLKDFCTVFRGLTVETTAPVPVK